MNALHVIPTAGLANRLRVLGSAMWVAEERSIPLVMTWPDDDAISVPFEALFTNALDRDAGRTTRSFVNQRLVGFESAGAGDDTVVEVRSHEAFSHTGGVPAYTRPFWSAVRPHLLSLTPVEEVRRRVDAIRGRFAPTTIGVHVRSGTGPMRFDSPDRFRIETFFDAVDGVLAREKDAAIYLAADATGGGERFSERYGSRLLTALGADPDGVRANGHAEEGLRLALVDLLVLSGATCILGTSRSSFSAVAAILGGAPVRRLGGVPGQGTESDLTFFVETPLLKRVAWRFRSARYRGFRR